MSVFSEVCWSEFVCLRECVVITHDVMIYNHDITIISIKNIFRIIIFKLIRVNT